MLKKFSAPVSHKVVVFWTNGTNSVFNYVTDVEHLASGAVVLHGQDQEGAMVRRTNIIGAGLAANIEVRSITI